jgi:hypothetical protein
MPFPTNERLKNLEQIVRGLGPTAYYSHPSRDEVYHGVIVDVVMPSEYTSGYLKVAQSPPLDIPDDGALAFDYHDLNPLDNCDASFFDRVVPLNVDQRHLGLYFGKGQKISYWRYNGTGEDADRIHGSYVTFVHDTSFWARIAFDSMITEGDVTLPRYGWRAVTIDPTESNVSDRWSDYSPTYEGWAFNLSDALHGISCICAEQIVKVHRFVNPDATGSSSDDAYQFWFSAGTGGVTFFPVRLTQTGGSAGSQSSECSYSYTVKDITNAHTLGTNISLTGHGNRVVNATMTAGSYGEAYYLNGVLKLHSADERIAQRGCTPS